MAETVFVQPGDIGRFLSNIAGATCYTMGVPEKKAKEMAPVVDKAIALGLLLAQRQPQLLDACVQHWNSTYQTDADEYVDTMLNLYKRLITKEGEGGK
jgi:predicted O-linked N-acetylglucosamine transferase (SPINDLY family)